MQQQLLETRLLGHLAARGLGGRLPALQVALGESPVLVGIPDQQKPGDAVRAAPEDDAPGAGFALGAGLWALHAGHGPESAACEVRSAAYRGRASNLDRGAERTL
jgi:hypothetical protein